MIQTKISSVAEQIGPLPAGLERRLEAAGARFNSLSMQAGSDCTVDPLALLSERELLSTVPHVRLKRETLRGGGFLAPTQDHWVALNLPRDSDWELIPALTGGAVDEGDRKNLELWLLSVPSQQVIEVSTLLGLAVAKVPTTRSIPSPAHMDRGSLPWSSSNLQQNPGRRISELTVVDLSRLWAGPLTGSLLAKQGAHVLKVENESQPEQPLSSDNEFFARLNGQKESLLIDFSDRQRLGKTVASADIVIVSCRDRALDSLDLHPKPGQLWISISAHGHVPDMPQRIGFGDDCAAEAGAVRWTADGPEFIADALADPVTGLLASISILSLLKQRFSGEVRLDLTGSARWAMFTDAPYFREAQW